MVSPVDNVDITADTLSAADVSIDVGSIETMPVNTPRAVKFTMTLPR